jgi:hypothetical protein
MVRGGGGDLGGGFIPLLSKGGGAKGSTKGSTWGQESGHIKTHNRN